MAKEEINFEQFLTAVEPPFQEFISSLHKYLTGNDCKTKFELKSSGFFVSYSHNKKSIINLLFRKKGLIVRIYGENVNKYLDFMNTLPEEMFKAIEKAPKCKRLINPNDCNPKCPMGYDFTIKGKYFQKCRINCFMFDINSENNPYIKLFIENEIITRTEK